MRTTGDDPVRVRWLALLAAALVLLTVAVGARWSPLVELDQAVARRAYDATADHAGRLEAWDRVTTWGGPQVMRVLLLVGALAAALRRRFDLTGWLVVLTVVEGVVAPASKLVLGRPRPSWADPISTAGSTSFPSGHATAAATVAVALLLVARELRLGASARLVLAALAIAIATAVGASRVFLGVHYLTDVTAGMLLGALLALATYAAVGWLVSARRPGARRTATGPARGSR